MNEIEKKVLRLFLMSRGLSDKEIDVFISKTALVEREIDSAGFYTTIKILPLYKEIFVNSQEWSDAVGYTHAGIEVGFVIFPPNEVNYIVIEGFTYGEEYPETEIDYNVCSSASNK